MEFIPPVLFVPASPRAITCNMDMLHRLVVRHFTARPDIGGNTWGYPARGVTVEKWAPAVRSFRAK